ncbi:amino acid ABC transporter substrate-binding protein [Thorsellia anophelis]|uniref:Putative amino-acid transport system substrate-binding protein n=1 Tax=Thorsellia anophelis DSM 18579 TaxID=1123402 RepID=A0A1I0E1D0_9GAMM|nr:amino acid ABC transporter substrate-binding protein [Thorsellia anophelis]SET38127.1 putative amino-acid transport system substrate-binding protein [Thorsellia anophelis DSM 18579]
MNPVNKILAILLTITALVGCGDKKEAETASQEITIGATGLSFPSAYKKDNKLVGFDVEVAEEIAKGLNYKINWVTSDFSGLMGQLEVKKLDTVANVVAITPVRLEKYDFSTPYGYYGSQLVTHEANDSINTKDDFKGKTIAGVLGSNHVNNLKKTFPDDSVTIRTFETRDAAMTDAINQRVDGYVNSRPILLAEIRENKLPLKLVDKPIVVESVGFPFQKDERGEKLKTEFNEQLELMRQDGRLKNISEKYFGEDITVNLVQ